MTILGIDLEKSNERGEVVFVLIEGVGGPIEIADITGLQAALSALSTEVGTKATQSSVTALSDGLSTTNQNLDSVSGTANAAQAAASAAQTTANNAIPKADRVATLSQRGVLSGAIIPFGGTTPVGMQPFDIIAEKTS